MHNYCNWKAKGLAFSLPLLDIFILSGTLSFGQAVDSNATAKIEPAGTSASGLPSDAATIEKGKSLFIQNCKSCHNYTDEVVIGPGLKGILERRTLAWILPWVKNSQAVIASGDKYAVDLYKKYNNTQMQSFDLKDEDIKSILAYVDTESKKGPAPADTKTGDMKDGKSTDKADSGLSSGYVNIILGVLGLVLVLILGVLVLLVTVISKYLSNKENELSEEDKELLNQRFDLTKFLQSRIVIGGVVLVFSMVVAKAGIDKLVNVGVQQGYAPKQPIAFSHKLHAGQYEIQCNYCHIGVNKGKNATIPAANICMNCHNEIKRTSPEIVKIYEAIEKNQPIEWIRVHNLPDFAYFNHSQHVQVGGLACNNCHGEVQTMEVIQQRTTLTMGWCIDCHRQTVVQAEGNAYYDKLLATHKQTNGDKPMKVENIGGLECAKCHY